MGLYDPAFERKPFVVNQRPGEVPGSIVFGGSRSKGCVWPGQGGKWFAARKEHPSDKPYPSFDTMEEAADYIVAPLRKEHEDKEDYRKRLWDAAAPKRRARAEKSKEKEAKRRQRKGDKTFAVLNAEGERVGLIVRQTLGDAVVAAASLLGYSKLPQGYRVEQAAE